MKLPKTKILFVITHLDLGGAQKQLLSIIKNLDRDKSSLHLFAGDYGYLKKEFMNLSYLNIKLIPELRRNIHPLYDFIAFLKLYFYIKKNRFDIVHTHSPKASILGRWAAYLAGVRNIVYTVHGWPFHHFMNPLAYHFYLFLERVTARITKKLIVVSKADLERGFKNKVSVPDNFSLIHYGVEIEKFDKVYKERRKLSPSTVITISSLKPQKGIFYFLRIAKELQKKNPELNFVIVGGGPLRKKVEKKIEYMGLKEKVILKGWLSEISVLLKESSLFVLTSLWEGLPVSLIEVVISGVPVVVTNTGGVLDIVQSNKQGIVVTAGNLPQIQEACWEILKNCEQWSKIIKDNRERFNLSYWSIKRMAKETENIYKEIEC